MALIECRECKRQISNKAKQCPECGFEPPKISPILKWLALSVILFLCFAYYQSLRTNMLIEELNNDEYIKSILEEHTEQKDTLTTTNEKSEAVITDETKKEPIKAEPTEPSWEIKTSTDEMTGMVSAYAHSPITYPSRSMSFPYHDVKSWMGVGCDKVSEWAYFGFNSAPNLTDTDVKDGYNSIFTRVKWGKKGLDYSFLTQYWGDKFIQFDEDAKAIKQIANSSEVMLELQWHGESAVYFTYSLKGSAKALAEIRKICDKGA